MRLNYWNVSFTPDRIRCCTLHSVYIPRNVDWNVAVIGLSAGTIAYIGILRILDRIYISSIQHEQAPEAHQPRNINRVFDLRGFQQ